MNIVSKSWLAVTGLAFSALICSASWAMGDEFHGDRDPARMLAYMADALDLSETQESDIRTLYQELSANLAGERERMEELRELLAAQVDDFDAGTAQTYADQIGEIAAVIAYATTSTRASVRTIMSVDQRAALDEMEAERAERRERRIQGGSGGRKGKGRYEQN